MRARPLAKIVVLLGVLAVGLSLLGPSGCSTSAAYADPCPDADGSLTIGGYCDQILPVFCDYAVNTCGVGGTIASCVANALATCCQGTCSRNVCPVDPAALQSCVKAYAGPDAGLASIDAGLLDGGQDVDAGASCLGVDVGIAPTACQSLIVLR